MPYFIIAKYLIVFDNCMKCVLNSTSEGVMKRSSVVLASLLISLLPSANADTWGCEVLLCLSNPAGATAVAECEAPIEKLWRELAKGNGFPGCDMGSSSANANNYAGNQWASANNCPPQYIRYRYHDSTAIPYCAFAGVITVNVNGKPYSRTWWNGRDTVMEALSPDAKGSGYNDRFERDYAKWKAEQDRIAAEKEKERREYGGF